MKPTKQNPPKNPKDQAIFTDTVPLQKLRMTPESSAMVHYLLDDGQQSEDPDTPPLPDKRVAERRRDALQQLIEGAFG